MDAGIDTLATALYVRIDDWLKMEPGRAPYRPAVGICPHSATPRQSPWPCSRPCWGTSARPAGCGSPAITCATCSPTCLASPVYNKRLRGLAATMNWLAGMPARDTSLWTDDVWVVDSTPVECDRSRKTARRSELAGWAEYGYCASHSAVSVVPGHIWSRPRPNGRQQNWKARWGNPQEFESLILHQASDRGI